MKQYEANLLAKYLGAEVDDENLLNKYIIAIEKLGLILSQNEEKTISKIIKMPFLLPFLDGAWALQKPENGIRKRILIMSALIETEPKYVNLFLLQKDARFPVINIVFCGFLAVLKGVIGVILLVILRWR